MNLQNFIFKKLKGLFKKSIPLLNLKENTFKRLPRNRRNKLIESFLINPGILGMQKQRELSKKYDFSLPWFFIIGGVISPPAFFSILFFLTPF